MASRPKNTAAPTTTEPPAGRPLPFQTAGRREAGVLLHVTSLPGPFGIGDLGPAAHRWIDRLAAAGQSWWQMLPLSPPAASNSPYQCYSAFAGNPLLLSPEALQAEGLLRPAELLSLQRPAGPVDYAFVQRAKSRMLRSAFVAFRQGAGDELQQGLARFVATTPWLADYALFLALHAAHGDRPWTDWPTSLRRRDPAAMAAARERHAEAIHFYQFVQFVFARQLSALRHYARSRSVGLIGDVPIFVAHDSADVWTHPHLFQLDRRHRPRAVAGVPPDAFSSTGQRWNNPLYDWTAMAADGYRWWISRLQAAFQQADVVRLDHFRGFDAYWRIPAAAKTAQTGQWVDGPGEAFFEALAASFKNLPMIAEDLGLITPRVNALRDRFALPGMRVIQFGLGSETDSIHLPHRFPSHCVAYSGTHDNDTARGWFAQLGAAEKRRAAEYVGEPLAVREPSWTLIRLVWASVAGLAITPLQDMLALPSSARMNTPGSERGNWRWRATDDARLTSAFKRLAAYTRTYARCSSEN